MGWQSTILARIYREARRGEIESYVAGRLAAIFLKEARSTIEDCRPGGVRFITDFGTAGTPSAEGGSTRQRRSTAIGGRA